MHRETRLLLDVADRRTRVAVVSFTDNTPEYAAGEHSPGVAGWCRERSEPFGTADAFDRAGESLVFEGQPTGFCPASPSGR